MKPIRPLVLFMVGGPVLGGCTSFAAVRSAEVYPGPSITMQASVSTPPGDEAAWFWSFDCAYRCNHAIAATDLSITFGHASESAASYALGVGLDGVYPYLDGYVQLNRHSRNPYGVGARFGVPVDGWNQYRVYGRYDRLLANGNRLLLNPSLFYYVGNSPNGANPGSFLAFVQGIGLLIEGPRVSFTPAVSFVLGRGERRSYGRQLGSFTSMFATFSLAVTFHRRRPTP